MPALPSLPCSAITGRSCPLWPGGMEITQLVLMPPRAAEMNEPEILVGKLLPAVGGSNGAGAACGSSGSTRAPKAHTPAARAGAGTPTEQGTAGQVCHGRHDAAPIGVARTATP